MSESNFCQHECPYCFVSWKHRGNASTCEMPYMHGCGNCEEPPYVDGCLEDYEP